MSKDQLAEIIARIEALEARANATPRRTKVLRDAKSITTKSGSLMVFLNIKHAGEYMDLIVSGHNAEAASALVAGDEIEYSVEKVDRKPATGRDGSPIMSQKTGLQIVNVSGFAEGFSIIGGAPAAKPAARVDSTGAPRRVKPAPVDVTDDEIPF